MQKEINQHLELGKLNFLRADRLTPHGIFFMAQDGKDVLLPKAYVTDEMIEDSIWELFLYTDSQDRLIATTLRPKAMLDEVEFFEVIDIAPFGAFVDWNLPKDLLVPKKFQKTPFKIGEKRFLKVVYDEKTHRLVGTEQLKDFFDKNPKGLYPKDEVEIMVISKTKLGYKVIVQNMYEGLIFHNEIFENIEIGDKKIGFIKQIRSDGNIDISLRQIGAKRSGGSSQKILEILKNNGGIMPYNYKSDAELIKNVFGVSKKDFKRSLTKLQDENKIEVKDSGIYLKKD